MAEIEYKEAEYEAFLESKGAVEERKRCAGLIPRVKELARSSILAETEEVRLKRKWEKADAVIRLYQTEGANARKGNF